MASSFRPPRLWPWPLPTPASRLLPSLPPGPLAPGLASGVGSVLTFMGPLPDAQDNASPQQLWGWLLCDGASYPISQFPELFQVIGYIYSPHTSGDTFNVPDLRGYFLRGVDAGSGHDPDTANRKLVNSQSSPGVGSFQADAFQEHEHDYNQSGAPQPVTAGNVMSVSASHPGTTTGMKAAPGASAPSSSKYETRPKNVAVYYFIRYSSAPGPFQPPLAPPSWPF